jgi:hypothetical protein
MFRHATLALILAAGFAGCSVLPQGAAAGASPGGAVAAAEKLRLAMIDPTRPALDALVAENLSYGHSGGRIDTKASFIGDLLDGKSDFVTIAITDQTVAPSQDVVVIRHTLTGQTNDNGKAGNVSIKVLQVWQQQAGQWRLLARQAVRPG